MNLKIDLEMIILMKWKLIVLKIGVEVLEKRNYSLVDVGI